MGGVCLAASNLYTLSPGVRHTRHFYPWEIVESVTRRTVTPKPINVTQRSLRKWLAIPGHIPGSPSGPQPASLSSSGMLAICSSGRSPLVSQLLILRLDPRSTVHVPWSAVISTGSGRAMESTKRWTMCVFRLARALALPRPPGPALTPRVSTIDLWREGPPRRQRISQRPRSVSIRLLLLTGSQ